MKPTNAMEGLVREQLRRYQEEWREEPICWCPLCRADMLAHALSALPPRYFTRNRIESQTEAAYAPSVRDEVARAVRHVERHPKHDRGGAVSAGDPVWVVNFPLEESVRLVEDVIRSAGEDCDCWGCRCDMVAFALNRYPARYGVEHGGATHLLERDRSQMREELTGFLSLARQVVTTVPRH